MQRAQQRRDLFRIRAVGRRSAIHEDLYHRVLTMPWWLFFAGAALAYLAANAVFAALYLLEPGCVANARLGSFEDHFFFSVQTLATIGYGAMAPQSTWAHAIVMAETLTGLFGLALMTGLTFAKFSRPTARILFSDKAVIGNRDGVPHLMFRLANYRHNDIVEAQLRVLLLEDQVTKEGERLRVPRELPLVRSTNAFFRLSWTAFHRIDETSPFFGPDPIAAIRERNGLVLLSVTGLDETIAQSVHARYFYEPGDVVVGARFKDILSVEPDGTRVIDYASFHEVVPE